MDFLSFSPDYWDGPRHNRHYFCEELSKEHKVIFCSPPFYMVKLMREIGKGTLNKSGIKKINENLTTYSPSKILFNQYRVPLLDKWFEKLRLKKIKKIMKQKKFDKPILLIWHPNFVKMIEKIDSYLTVFYMYDQYSGYTGSSSNKPSPEELIAIEKSDLVFVLSQKLLEDKKRFRADIHHLPNAADFEMFSKSRRESTPIPLDIKKIPGPKIGYLGTINEKLNVKLLDYISDKKPNWSIVLVGRENYTYKDDKNSFDRLILKENVYWLGGKKYDTIPQYIKGLDICLMCYVVNNWTYYGDPSKMHEYLASGKPTIAADLFSIREFEEVIDIPETFDEWVKIIDFRLQENNPELIKKRIQAAKNNSYSARIEESIDLIRDKINIKYK